MSKRAAIYARVSSDEQSKNNSLPTQLDAMRQYAERQGFTLAYEFKEDYTGTKLDRPELAKVRHMIKEQMIDAVIVYQSDRLTRSPADGIILREEFARSGVELHYATRGKVGMSPDAEMFSGFEDLLARGWLLRMKEAMIRGRWGKAKGDPTSGKQPYIPGTGRPPYGYVTAGGMKQSTLEPFHEQADIVRMIFAWYVTDRLPVAEIVRKLHALNTPAPGTRRGNYHVKGSRNAWTAVAVYEILRRETYSGVYYCHRETRINNRTIERPRHEWIAIPVPAIVEHDQWLAAQERLNSGRQQSRRNTKHQHLLARRLHCTCGYTISQRSDYTSKGGSQRFYYYCSSITHSAPFAHEQCGSPYFQAKGVDAAVWRWIVDLLTHPERMLIGFQEQQQDQRRRNSDLYDRIDILDERIAQEQAKADTLLDLFLDNRLPKDMLYQRQQALEQTLETLRSERLVLERQVANVVISDEHIQMLRVYGAMVAGELEQNDSYEFRRGLVEDLGITGTLGMEEGERVLYVHWLSQNERVDMATELASARSRR